LAQCNHRIVVVDGVLDHQTVRFGLCPHDRGRCVIISVVVGEAKVAAEEARAKKMRQVLIQHDVAHDFLAHRPSTPDVARKGGCAGEQLHI
jgi:hypothetical protein